MKKTFAFLKPLKRHGILLTIIASLAFLAYTALSGLSALTPEEASLIPTAREATVNEAQYNQVLSNEDERAVRPVAPVTNPFNSLGN